MCMVSIIIPVYNVQDYLAECLDSIMEQTYHNIEILLINDGSTDASGKICDAYQKKDSRIKVFHRKNSGVSATRNYGIGQSKGEWLFFVDSDDWIDKRTVEFVMDHVRLEDDICFIGNKIVKEYAAINDITIKSEDLIVKYAEETDFHDFQMRIFNRDRNAICDKNLIKVSSPCKFYRREMIIDNKILFPDNLPNGEDGIFNLYAYRYARSGVIIETPVYYYRQRMDSVTNKYTEHVETDFYKLHQEYKKFISTETRKKDFEEAWDERLIWSLSFCCILKYCNLNNSDSYQKRKKDFLKELELHYKKEIESVELKNFTLQKKIIFWAIKRRWFFLITFLCFLNNRKNR